MRLLDSVLTVITQLYSQKVGNSMATRSFTYQKEILVNLKPLQKHPWIPQTATVILTCDEKWEPDRIGDLPMSLSQRSPQLRFESGLYISEQSSVSPVCFLSILMSCNHFVSLVYHSRKELSGFTESKHSNNFNESI